LWGQVDWCAALSKLPNLRVLTLQGISLQSHQLLHLCALRHINSLGLMSVDAVDDAVAAVLASSMTGLEVLHLQSRSIKSTHGLFSALGRLPKLVDLTLAGDTSCPVADAQLLLLSGLTALRCFRVSGLACSDAAKQQFIDAHPGLL
jgi:hypothetical protein